jgi:hypothetical protein
MIGHGHGSYHIWWIKARFSSRYGRKGDQRQ